MITVDHGLRETWYIHLMLEKHEVIWANGVETESFHPASASLQTLEARDRGRLLQMLPGLAQFFRKHRIIGSYWLCGSPLSYLRR
ncbi:MAG: Hint domain-containing protein [Primorskyibacter sp.]